MINNAEFTKRLKKVLEFYSESAASFSEKIGVQRSSISHLLSGRNKPSLEFVLKVLSAYPEIDLYWLMNGKGQFPTSSKTEKAKPIKVENDLFSNKKIETPKNEIINTPLEKNKQTDKEIERIVIFYKDGSFSNFEN